MHTAHNKDILKLSESATATMLRRPPDKSPPMDHRIMFSMIFKYCELINYIVLNARLEIIRGQRRMRSGELAMLRHQEVTIRERSRTILEKPS